MAGNFYTPTMRACFLTVLFLSVICYSYATDKAGYGDECHKNSDCGYRLKCVSMPTPSTPDKTTTDAQTPTTDAQTTTTEAETTTPAILETTSTSSEEEFEYGECRCEDEYEYIEKKCRLVLSDDFYCESYDDCELLEPSPIYNYPYEYLTLTCSNNVCYCGLIWILAMNESTPMCFKVPDVDVGPDPPVIECEVDQQCFQLNDDTRNTTASCNSTVCACDEDWKIYTFTACSNIHTHFCARTLGQTCDEDIHCNHIEHASCKNDKCTCDDGYSADSDDSDFKCSGGSALVSSIFILLTALWLTKESH